MSIFGNGKLAVSCLIIATHNQLPPNVRITIRMDSLKNLFVGTQNHTVFMR